MLDRPHMESNVGRVENELVDTQQFLEMRKISFSYLEQKNNPCIDQSSAVDLQHLIFIDRAERLYLLVTPQMCHFEGSCATARCD